MLNNQANTPISFKDYKFDYNRHVGYSGLNYYMRFLYASNEKTGKEIVIQYLENCCKELQTEVYEMIDSNYRDLPGVVKIIGFSLPLVDGKNSKCLEINPSDELWKEIKADSLTIIIIYEFLENDFIKLNNFFLRSEGAKESKINPTIRSKIIFGIASIMNQANKNKFNLPLRLENIFLNDKKEPKIFIPTFADHINQIKDIVGPTCMVAVPYEVSPEAIQEEEEEEEKRGVYSYGMMLYRMFTNDVIMDKNKKQIRNHVFHLKIIRGERPERTKNIPECYWELIQKCWAINQCDRPTFDEIVETLKDDKFALEEFGMKTDLKELHKYQKSFEQKEEESNSDLKQLQKELSDFKLLLNDPEDEKQYNENCFIGEDEEEAYHDVLDKVGEGATSVTYKVVDKRTGKFMCKKVLKENRDDKAAFKNLKDILKEFEVLHGMKYPCICKAIGVNTSEPVKDGNLKSDKKITTVAIFLDFVENKLSDVLKSGIINNTLKTRIVVEIVHAMNYIHKHGMIHRDLKIDNIMLNSVFEVKLVDFGLVRIHEVFNNDYSFLNDSMTKGVGTLAYMSPEMMNEEHYDYKTDVYSFGIVLYFIFIGKLPKQGMKDKMNGKMIDLPSSSPGISQFCIDLIKKCLKVDPNERPSFEDILIDIRNHNYQLAGNIDRSVIYLRDQQLELFDKYK